MKYTEIDGEMYEVKDCGRCPFRDMGDGGYGAHCTHPLSRKDKWTSLEIDCDGEGIAEGCPLRDTHHDIDEIINKMFTVQKGEGIIHKVKPCPFCGSTDIEEVYYDEEGNRLEERMMEEANNDGCDYKSWQDFLYTHVYMFLIGCANCRGSIGSTDSIEVARAKWNRRE